MNMRRTVCMAAVLLTAGVLIGNAFGQTSETYSRDQLIRDARQLLETIELTHPDPYINGGGRIAFHQRFQEVLRAIPASGMTQAEFYHLLLPCVAAIGDSHTGIRMEGAGHEAGPGLPLGFRIIETDFIVGAVPDRQHEHLLGARLQSVAGISFGELVKRQGGLRGAENNYGRLAFLTRSLISKQGLIDLIPEWTDRASIESAFVLPDGKVVTATFPCPYAESSEPITPTTRQEIPSTASSDVAFEFVDANKQTGVLVIRSLMRYREAFESMFADGMTEAIAYAHEAYRHFHDSDPPADSAVLLTAIPSATETLAAMIEAMSAAGTPNLIVDLRDNTGGNSLLREMLIYTLFGTEGLMSMRRSYSVPRLSDLYFATYSNDSLTKHEEDGELSLVVGDYDFGEQRGVADEERDRATRLSEFEETFAKMPTFWEFYQTGSRHQPAYKPRRIVVVCTPLTFSSGFNVLTALNDQGATVVGTPPGQPGNNFGDVLMYKLNETGIQGFVSYKQVVTYPDDPEKGRCLIPDVVLTYDKLRSYGFDPNAEVLLALEVLGGR
ncbi:MAG TPA: S41 family peptidase [Acidobacteriota bacterium]|nr:S41 family peptidase [Acidobacteriota bacterium]